MAGRDIVGDAAAGRFIENLVGTFKPREQMNIGEMVNLACVRPEVSFESYMATNYAATYEAMTELPEEVLFTANSSTVKNFKNCFRGMAALETSAPFNTRDAINLSGMYYGCESLPEEFPYIINCQAVESIAGLAGIFEGSSVVFARFENVRYPLRFQMTKTNLGSQMQRIIINGIYGAIKV